MAVLIPLVKPSQIALFAVAILFGSVATTAVGLRLVAVRIARRRLDASDWSILVAWLFMMGLMVSCILEAVLGGFGWHYDEINERFGQEPITQYHKIILPLEVLWNLSLTATKISVLAFYTKVFAVTHISLIAKITMVIVALLGSSGFLSTMLICHPFAYNWDLDISGGHCGSQSSIFAVFGILNLVTDVTVLTMPITSLLGLRMPLWKKAWLLATFTVGFLTCIASIIRLVYLARIDYDDVTYTSVTAVLMTAVEPSLAVMLACIPLLRPLLGPAARRLSAAPQRSGKSGEAFTTWLSTGWSRSRGRGETLTSSRKRGVSRMAALPGSGSSGMMRLGSTEEGLGLDAMGAVVRSVVPSGARGYDDSDEMELRYVLCPGEGVSHHAHVEALPQRGSISDSVEDEAIRQQIEEAAGGAGKAGPVCGFAIVVKQEWNVESELKNPP